MTAFLFLLVLGNEMNKLRLVYSHNDNDDNDDNELACEELNLDIISYEGRWRMA